MLFSLVHVKTRTREIGNSRRDTSGPNDGVRNIHTHTGRHRTTRPEPDDGLIIYRKSSERLRWKSLKRGKEVQI